jgi:capsular exopolysaccharide synthesis family protein
MQEENVVMLAAPDSPAAEAYRSLRVNLEYAGLDQPIRTLVVALPAVEADNDHDVNTAVNLAVATAQTGKHVVLIDADLRHPQLHEIFEVPNTVGLAQAILALDSDLPTVTTEVPNLTFMPAGAAPTNAADVLSSEKMSRLLKKLTQEADLVILKAPPVTAAVDTPALAAHTDGLLLVTRSGHTRRDRVVNAQEKLAQFDVNVLGAVLTDAPKQETQVGY